MDNNFAGSGIFSWDGTERRSDRYGSFTLDVINYHNNETYPDARFDEDFVKQIEGCNVRITVTVLVSRVSGHVGDNYRGLKPSQPAVGEVIDLGVGKLFVEPCSWSSAGISIGIVPSDGRASDWLDPVKLYRLHDQTVAVTITETEDVSDFVPSYVSDVADTSTILTGEDHIGGYIQYKGLGWK